MVLLVLIWLTTSIVHVNLDGEESLVTRRSAVAAHVTMVESVSSCLIASVTLVPAHLDSQDLTVKLICVNQILAYMVPASK